MGKIDLDYEPPDEAELTRRAQPITVASVIAGGLLGLFFTPMLWAYATTYFPAERLGTTRRVAEVVAAGAIVTLAIFAGRRVERVMPDTRGMAVGIYVSSATVAAACVAISILTR